MFDIVKDKVDIVLGEAGTKAALVKAVVRVGGSSVIPFFECYLRTKFANASHVDLADKDTAIGVGAGCQAARLSDAEYEAKAPLLQDCSSHSYGVETKGGNMSVLIPKNTKTPVRVSKSYTTTVDYQEDVDITVFQGESMQVAHNERVTDFRLTGIPQALKGQAEVVVTFSVDANSSLNVSASSANGQRDYRTLNLTQKKLSLTLKADIAAEAAY